MPDEEREDSSPLPPTEDSDGSAPQATVETQPTEDQGTDNFQKRIDTVVGQRNTAQRENEELKQRLAVQGRVDIPATDANEPTLEQFDFDESRHQSALIDYRVKKGVNEGLNSYQNAQALASEEFQAENRRTTYLQRVQDFSPQVTDWNETVGGLQLNLNAQNAIMVSDVGPQVAYTIAKDPLLAAEINRLDPVSVAMRVGEISATVRANGVTNRISTAPDPIDPPGGQGGALKTSELGKMSLEDFMKNQGVVKTSV